MSNERANHQSGSLLHWVSVVVRWFGSKRVETEPALQLLAGLVPLAAPGALGIGTCEVSESAHKLPGLRELMAHPERHDRVATGHRQRCQRIGQRPTALPRLSQYLSAGSFLLIDFCLIFVPFGYCDEPQDSLIQSASSVQLVLTPNTPIRRAESPHRRRSEA